MSADSRSRLRGLAVLAAIAAFFVIAPVAQAAPIFKAPTPNKGTYLAIGDSLAFGYQGYKVAGCAATGCTSPDTQFSTGYVDVFASAFGATYPGVKTVNLGCPGETSATLLNATNATTGCTTYPFAIHTNHPGKTQLKAALKYVDDAKANPITINIGANDVLGLVRSCTGSTGAIDLGCVQAGAPATFAAIQANLGTALRKIRDEGEKAEIIVVGLYNPLYVAILGTQGPAAAAGTDALTNSLNALTAQTADKYKAYFVDPMPTFNPGNGSNPPAEAGAICTLTLMCADLVPPAGPDGDIHPTDAGYAALGNLVYQASGY